MLSLKREMVLRPDGNGGVLYNPKTGQLLEINRKATRIISLMDGGNTIGNMSAKSRCPIGQVTSIVNNLRSLNILEEVDERRSMDVRAGAMEPPLRTVTVEINKNCNLRCAFCYANAGKNIMWSKDEIKKLGEDLMLNGVLKVILTGGEPTLHPDLLAIIKNLRGLGLGIELLSNGTNITDELAMNLKALGIARIRISLDGAAPKTHDRLRGVKGAWKKTIEGIKNCKRTGLYTEVNAVVCKLNASEVLRIYALSESLGVDRFYAEPMVNLGRGKNCDIPIEPAEYRKINDALMREANVKICENEGHNKETCCGIGFLNAAIDVHGNLIPCPLMQALRAGNAIKSGIRKCWEESEVMNALRQSTVKNIEKCSKCSCKAVCRGGCKARTYAMTGRLDAPDGINCSFYGK